MSSTPIPPGSTFLTSAFVALALGIVVLFVYAVYSAFRRTGGSEQGARRAAVIAAAASAAWLLVTAGAAAQGLLSFSQPPSMQGLLFVTLAVSLGVALSPLGKRLATGVPIALLVGFQGFRIIVELLLHRAYLEGLMPVQMTYSGRNFDIISGITALGIGLWLARARGSLTLIALWNVLGVALLANIVIVALLSAPTPLRVFMNEPANVWVTQAPWVWLPTVMVVAAVTGHVLVLRYLLHARRATRASAPARSPA